MKLQRTRVAFPALLAACSLLSYCHSSQAIVIAEPDPEDGFGATPAVMTVDVFDENLLAIGQTGQRGIAFDRKIRQSFQVDQTFNVGAITVAYNGEPGGAPGGLALRIYQVDDVLAGGDDEFSPANLFREILFDGVVPDTVTHLRFNLTGNSIFSLPARGTSGDSLGYAIEFSAPFPSPSEPTRGQVRFTNSGDDFYAGGRYYTTGGASSSHRDIGLSFTASDQPVFLPGDTNGDDIVDIETDLAAILNNFRTSVLSIQEGDLSGNGFVDFDDFDLWKENYSGPIPAELLAAFGIAPEPTSAALLTLSGLVALTRRRNRE